MSTIPSYDEERKSGRIRIIMHPLASGVITIERYGVLVTAVNGTTVASLHAVFRRICIRR
jgi:hypothetical protein